MLLGVGLISFTSAFIDDVGIAMLQEIHRKNNLANREDDRKAL